MHMHRQNHREKRGWLTLAEAVVGATICLGGLFGCSDQVLGEVPGTVAIHDSGNGPLQLETDPAETGNSIGLISPSDPFAGANHVLRADFLRTGASDAILLRLDDTVILIDTGETDDYGKISGKLNECGITAIDYLILTHFDNDHIGTASRILKDYTVRTVYMPDYVRDSRLYRGLEDVLGLLADTTVTHRLTEDVRLTFDWGSIWINPTRLYEAGITLGADAEGAVEENNFSLITSVYFGDIRLLFTGDAEEERMAEFNALFDGETYDYDLVKTPHHGGYDKSFGTALEACRPRYCVVCLDNEDAVEGMLKTKMISVAAAAYYTCNGNIFFTTDGVSMVMIQN